MEVGGGGRRGGKVGESLGGWSQRKEPPVYCRQSGASEGSGTEEEHHQSNGLGRHG